MGALRDINAAPAVSGEKTVGRGRPSQGRGARLACRHTLVESYDRRCWSTTGSAS